MVAVVDPVIALVEKHGCKTETFFFESALLLRQPSFRHRVLQVCLVLAAVFVTVLPLIAAGTTSFVEAQDVCFERVLQVPANTGHLRAKRNNKGDLDYLYPSHFFGVAAMWTSLLCLLIWLEKSPHKTSTHTKGIDLDKTLGSFCIVQYLASVVGSASMVFTVCTSSAVAHKVWSLLFIGTTAGASVIVTNILAHRYLVLRAEAMCTSISNGDADTGFFSLEKLHSSLKWEICAFFIVVLASGLYPFESLEKLNFILGGLATSFVMVSDAAFSVTATAIFLRPVRDVLHVTRGVRSAAATRMLKTRNSTFAGTLLCLFSSTLLYINLVAFLFTQAADVFYFEDTPFLQPFVFGIYLDSILNSFGILVITGFFNDLTTLTGASDGSAKTSAKVAVRPSAHSSVLGPFDPEGQAYD